MLRLRESSAAGLAAVLRSRPSHLLPIRARVLEILRALHSVNDPALPASRDVRWPPHVLPLEFLIANIEQEGSQAHVDPGLVRDAIAFVRERWDAFDEAGRGLVHGDPHLENFLWDGERITSLLDLEWARRSWIQVDLEILLAFCDHPWLFVAEDYEDRSRRQDYAEAELARGSVSGVLRPPTFTRPTSRALNRTGVHTLPGRWIQRPP